MSPRSLARLRVLDLSQQIAGPYCAKLLAGFGAEVIKVEPPSGDPQRNAGPFFRTAEGTESSIPFLWLNTGKKSVTLDLHTPRGKELFRKLVSSADVLVESFKPGALQALGLAYADLQALNPRLVMISLTPFGQTGPYREYEAEEIQLYAMSGCMHMTGDPDKPPLTSGPAATQASAGLHGYTALLLALLQREKDGLGQHIDLSAMECGLESVESHVNTHLQTGKKPRRGPHAFAPWGLYRCVDGFVSIICAPFRNWKRGAAIFEDERLTQDKYKHVRDRVKYRDEVNAIVTPWIQRHTKRHVFEAGQSNGLAFGYLATFNEVMNSEQNRARGFFQEVTDPATGRHVYAGAPFKAPGTPWQCLPAPRLGEHNAAVYGQALGLSAQDLQALQKEGIV